MKTVHVKVIALFLCVSATVACSNKSSTKQTSPGQQQSSSSASQPQVQQSAETQPQQAPVQQASKAPPVNMAEKVSGAPATEKYRLGLTNYAKVPVTVSINGQWVGQWDNNTDVPLESVVQDKNQLTVELAGEPKNTVTVNIYTKRDNQDVTILSLNFQGQTGSHTYTFAAK